MSEEVKLPEGWEERVGAFAKAVEIDVSLINDALVAVVGKPSAEALAILSDEEAAPFEDLKTALTVELTIPSGVLKKNIGLLRGQKKTIPEKSVAPTAVSLDVLPPLPDDESFLKALKTGGELKVNPTEVICAMRAAIANKLGLYDLPELIRDKMEEFAENSETPCGADFFTLRNLITKRSYADVLSVLNVEGSFVTVSRKNAFLAKLDSLLWTTLNDFYKQLFAWQQAWVQGSQNPAAMTTAMAAIVSAFSSGGVATLPPGLMAPPDTSPVRDSAETVVNNINKIFAGIGIPIARALAYEALNIKTVLENASLPASLGAINKEQMLKMLKADISSDYVRLESNITRFMLSIMELSKITAGPQEQVYLGAMLQLGLSIQWDKLIANPVISYGKGPKQF
jgi:hypothetical protein